MVVVVVVFALNRSFYPTKSAVSPVSFLIILERYKLCGHSETEKNQTLKIQGRQMLAYRVREHNKKKRHPRNKSYEKKKQTNKKQNKKIDIG